VNQTHFQELNRATSMTIESGKSYKIGTVLKQLLKNINENFKHYESRQNDLLASYNSMLYMINKEIMFQRNHEMYNGILLGVNEAGQLMVNVNGKIKTFRHKEIKLIFE
jgi:BirA family biotin operon repressor/biotin-[acetyl-CoA-carboxylase] ligase